MGTQTVTTDTLVEIEKRVLWLSTAIVDAANRRAAIRWRATPAG